MKSRDIVDAIGHTPLVEMERLSPKPSVRFFAKLEGHNPTGSLKDRIAKYMIEKAEAEGQLTKDRVILEATSGNTGIALAMLARRKGYRMKVVVPENVGTERVELLRAFGVEIIYSPGNQGTNGAIRVAQQMTRDDSYFMPYQYGNPANPLAHYETTGPEILRDLPRVDVFIAGLGTGGTLMGVARRLKEKNPNTKIIAVVPHPGENIQGLRSLEEGFIPPILDLNLLDGRVVITNMDAFRGTRELLEVEGIFAGVSSGAVVQCAKRFARRMEKGNVVMLLADGGWKYLSTGLWTKDEAALAQSADGQIWW
ncbi:MAG: cysteine synthase family protein [Chloroflexi bacterium]|nr:cysteine synthase family protein [Chloroflexota bacterium]